MSDKRPWIDPCGLNTEDGNCTKKRKISLKENNPNIEKEINAILKQLEDLKKFMSSTFEYVKEESLISHEYDFLNPPKNIENTYVRAFHILQANVMAIVQLLKELENSQSEKVDTYRRHLNETKEKQIQLLCNMQFILTSKGLCYKNVTEDKMSIQFKNNKGSLKFEKHCIALRQIRYNMKYLSDEFKKIKYAPKEELKLQYGSPKEVLKSQNDTQKDNLKLQNGAPKEELKLQNGDPNQELKLQNVDPNQELKLQNRAPKKAFNLQNNTPKKEELKLKMMLQKKK